MSTVERPIRVAGNDDAVQQPMKPIESRHILDMRVDATSYADAAERVTRWAAAGESRYVCVGTVHMVMEAHDDQSFRRVVNEASLVTPDGMPLVWGLKALGAGQASRVYGPTLTPTVCARAEAEGIPVGFYGGTPETLDRMIAHPRSAYPRLQIA